MVAAHLQQTGRARLFGRTSVGMVVPSQSLLLANGCVLRHPVADYTTARGDRLEGVGVAPDVFVSWTRADLLYGRDPDAEAARAWLGATVG